jgi:COP9 signalosome complex subunit 5
MDSNFAFDEASLQAVKLAKPWMADPRYFKTAFVSSGAAIKMLSHANSGVEKGLRSGTRPVEVMGLLLGRPSTGADKHAIIVTDAFPLPVEGAETRVLADDQEVMNYMIELSENLEKTRKERFIGWYHSHPFDVDVHSHCHLSATDVSTQLQWQRSEDNFGSPWLGIVIDPLRSLAKSRPEFGAFRAFPPEYSAPPNMCPDGAIVTDDSRCVPKGGGRRRQQQQLVRADWDGDAGLSGGVTRGRGTTRWKWRTSPPTSRRTCSKQ